MAMFNNGFPATYQPMYPAYTPVQVPQQNVAPVQNTVQGGLNWVSGEAGAKAYLVAPNTTVALYDSENQTIYLKSADASGMPSMKILDYTIRDTSKPNTPVIAENPIIYATKEDIEAINGDIKALKKKIEKLMKEDEDE